MREERRQLPPIVYDVQDASRHQAKATLEAAQAAAAKSDLLQPDYMDLKLKVVTAQKAVEQLEKGDLLDCCCAPNKGEDWCDAKESKPWRYRKKLA